MRNHQRYSKHRARPTLVLLAVLAASCAGTRNPRSTEDPGLAAESPRLDFLGDFNIGPGSELGGWPSGTIGGISAIAYDTEAARWLALSDAKQACRFIVMNIQWEDNDLKVEPEQVVYLTEDDGRPFEKGLDPEGLVLRPDGGLIVSVEGYAEREPVDEPRILEFSRNGRLERSLEVPPKFFVERLPPRKGVRPNKAFESLAITPSGEAIYTAAETALTQDGITSDFARGSRVRIVEYLESEGGRQPSREFVYPLEKLKPVVGFRNVAGTHGLAELVAISSTKLLAMERGFVLELSGRHRNQVQVRIFLIDLGEATDVSELSSLDKLPETVKPVRKHLVLDLEEIVPRLSPRYRRLDNFEGMGLGPELPGGGRSLVIVSDDNFSSAQRTAFLLFRVTLPTDSAVLASGQ